MASVQQNLQMQREGRTKGDRYSVIKCSTINKNCPFTF